MFEPLWKKMGGVLTDLAAVAVVMVATVLIEKLLGIAGNARPDNDSEADSGTYSGDHLLTAQASRHSNPKPRRRNSSCMVGISALQTSV